MGIWRGVQGVADFVIGFVDELSIPYGIRQTSNQPQVMLGDAAGNLIGTPTGESGDTALAVHIEHLHQTPWLHPFVSMTATTDTLNGAIAVGAKTLVLNDATGFNVGDCINISPPGQHSHTYRIITVIVTNTLTINAGTDVAYADGSGVTVVVSDMAVNGAVTPVVFSADPSTGEKVDIMRMMFAIASGSAPDDGKFGDLAALTNGVHFRRNINNGESFLTLGVWRKNADMKLDMFNVEYTSKAGGGNHGTNGRWSIFDGTGAVLNVDEENNEAVEMVIQDDLTNLVSFNASMQGHIEI